MNYGSAQERYVFVKVSTKTPLTTNQRMKMQINDDNHTVTKQLFFRQSYTFENVKSSDTTQMAFRASHTPATLQVEICEGDNKTEFTAYTSPFIS